jgi:hypothetical protein
MNVANDVQLLHLMSDQDYNDEETPWNALRRPRIRRCANLAL